MVALALDFWIFGNGWGLAQPHCDGRFYWLNDTTAHHKRTATFYTTIGGFGAQLRSFQWTHPRAGERRRLCGHDFVVFQSHRRWMRVEVSWAMTRMPDDIDGKNAAIRELEKDLDTFTY